MPNGKPAGTRCVQLTQDNQCAIFGSAERPSCCAGLQPGIEMCGDTREHALHWLASLEAMTAPAASFVREQGEEKIVKNKDAN